MNICDKFVRKFSIDSRLSFVEFAKNFSTIGKSNYVRTHLQMISLREEFFQSGQYHLNRLLKDTMINVNTNDDVELIHHEYLY